MTVVLGIDAATADAAVAVARDGQVIREVAVPPDEDGRPRHSQVLLPEIDRSVRAAGGWSAIELIAVGVGPGSFTGLRIGIATARALSQARAVPVVPVVTLAVLARGIAEHAPGEDRPALAVIDARRGEAFAAAYAPDGTELRPPAVMPPRDLAALVAELDSAPLAAGDGALRFAAELEAGGATVAPPQDPVHRIAARHVCGLGAAAPEVKPHEIEPLYLRPPDAKKWLERDRDRG